MLSLCGKRAHWRVSREEYAVTSACRRHQHPRVLPLSPLLLWWPLNIGQTTRRGYNGVHLDKAASMWVTWLFPSGSLMPLNRFDSSQHFPRQKEEVLHTSLLTSSFPSHFYLYNSRKAKSLWWFEDHHMSQMFWEKVHVESRSHLPWTCGFHNREKSSVCD